MDSISNLSECKSNTTSDVQYTTLQIAVRSSVVLSVSVTIIVSNLLNFAFLRTSKDISRVTVVFLTNLSTADFCAGLIGCLPSIRPAITGTWPYSTIWCQLTGIVHGSCSTVSIWTVGVIGVERYIATHYPVFYKHRLTPRASLGIVCLLWILGITTVLIPTTAKSHYILFHFQPEISMCGLYCESKWICITKMLLVLVVTGSVITFTTTSLAKSLRRKTPRGTLAAGSGNGTDQRTSSSREAKAVRLLIVTTGLYFLTWGPYSTLLFLDNLGIRFCAPSMLVFMLMWVSNSNGFVNVFIYSAIYPSFRTRLKKLLYKIFCCECFRPGSRVRPITTSEMPNSERD